MNTVFNGGASLFLTNEIESLNEQKNNLENQFIALMQHIDDYAKSITRVDLNTINYFFRAYCNSCTNIPEGVGNGFLEVEAIESKIILQKYYPYWSHAIYTRHCVNGEWSSWDVCNSLYYDDLLIGDIIIGNYGYSSKLQNPSNKTYLFASVLTWKATTPTSFPYQICGPNHSGDFFVVGAPGVTIKDLEVRFWRYNS